MLVRQLGVAVNEHGRHHEVPGDELLIGCLECLELVACALGQVGLADLIWHDRVDVLGADGAELACEQFLLRQLRTLGSRGTSAAEATTSVLTAVVTSAAGVAAGPG